MGHHRWHLLACGSARPTRQGKPSGDEPQPSTILSAPDGAPIALGPRSTFLVANPTAPAASASTATPTTTARALTAATLALALLGNTAAASPRILRAQSSSSFRCRGWPRRRRRQSRWWQARRTRRQTRRRRQSRRRQARRTRRQTRRRGRRRYAGRRSRRDGGGRWRRRWRRRRIQLRASQHAARDQIERGAVCMRCQERAVQAADVRAEQGSLELGHRSGRRGGLELLRCRAAGRRDGFRRHGTRGQRGGGH